MFKGIRKALTDAIYEQPPEEVTPPASTANAGHSRPVLDGSFTGSVFATAARTAPPVGGFSEKMTKAEVERRYYAGIEATQTPASAMFLKRMAALQKQEPDAHKRAGFVLALMADEGIPLERIKADLERVFASIDDTALKGRKFVESRLEEISRQQTDRDSAARRALAEKTAQAEKLQKEIAALTEGLKDSDREAKAAATAVQELMRNIGLECDETKGEIKQIADLLG